MHQQRMQCLTYVQCLIRNPVRFDLRFTFVGANDGATSCDVLIALRLTGYRPDTANEFCTEARGCLVHCVPQQRRKLRLGYQ
ncbi:hypothetical protein DPMN_108304 [Dreissena polymorpha]|uniref:Uncharacterized protein n=1 Tax=Dreissena polymorpha TaxID=45954 RepID=A0A9D4K8V6_DREPO|nr:hypothetical protein DPMN_108304 [Dreissena polymorpha]